MPGYPTLWTPFEKKEGDESPTLFGYVACCMVICACVILIIGLYVGIKALTSS